MKNLAQFSAPLHQVRHTGPGVIPTAAVFQAEGGISRIPRRTHPSEIPRPAGEGAGLRDDALVFGEPRPLPSRVLLPDSYRTRCESAVVDFRP